MLRLRFSRPSSGTSASSVRLSTPEELVFRLRILLGTGIKSGVAVLLDRSAGRELWRRLVDDCCELGNATLPLPDPPPHPKR